MVIWDGEESGDRTKVKKIEGEIAKSNPTETIEVTTNLHIVLITVDTSQKRLVETRPYAYNVYYGDTADSLTNDLGTSGLLHEPTGADPDKFIALGYKRGNLPTIIIAGEKPENLHIIHGSCRKIHGTGDDAFRHIDNLINPKVNTTPENRPQQLYLTGDQIYADEIPKIALPFINALGRQLFGDKKEDLVVKATSEETIAIPADMEHFPPNCRQFLVNDSAKFTGNGVASHLLSFQEYCSTYLHYWSPDVWSPELKLMLNQYKKRKL